MRRPSAAWRRFWFEPEETSTLALVRIAFGLVVLVWTLSLTRDADDFFTGSGILPGSSFQGEAAASWGLLDLFEGQLAVDRAAGRPDAGLAVPHRRTGHPRRRRGRVRRRPLARAPQPVRVQLGRRPHQSDRVLPDVRAVGRVALARPLAPRPGDVLGVPGPGAVGAAADAGPAQHPLPGERLGQARGRDLEQRHGRVATRCGSRTCSASSRPPRSRPPSSSATC